MRNFDFEPIRWERDYNVAWLKVPRYGDWVLINYGRAATPKIERDGSKNFYFVSPSAPSVRLPEGLYYWRSSEQVDIPGALGRRGDVVLKNNPTGRSGFRFVGGGKYRSDRTGHGWNAELFERDPKKYTVVDDIVGGLRR